MRAHAQMDLWWACPEYDGKEPKMHGWRELLVVHCLFEMLTRVWKLFIQCDDGYFAPISSTTCTACPAGKKRTSATGADVAAACTAVSDYYSFCFETAHLGVGCVK